MFIKSINNLYIMYALYCMITANIRVESRPTSGSFTASNPSNSATCLAPLVSGQVVTRTMYWDDNTTSLFNFTLTTSVTVVLFEIILSGVVISGTQFNGYTALITSTMVYPGLDCLLSGISSVSGVSNLVLTSGDSIDVFVCAGNVTIQYSPELDLDEVARTVSTANYYNNCL